MIKALLMLVCLTLTVPVFAIEMARVPKGKLLLFWLSPLKSKKNNNNKEQAKGTTIKVDGFKIMKYPVSVKQYREFLKAKPKWTRKNVSKLFADKSYLQSLDKMTEKMPITEVSWFAARAFCKHYKMRLPTINEWEYVAAASETKTDANKDEKFLRRILNWYGQPKDEKISDVGSIYKNKYGVWDLHGLIWEWTEDFNSFLLTGESREDSSFNKNLFCGGGSLNAGDKENYAAFMRFAFRASLSGNSSAWNLGFRCVR